MYTPPPPRNRIAELALVWSLSLPLLLKPTPLVQERARQWLGWLPQPCHQKTSLGFTLAEVLISMAILGVIVTFTIPKIISGSQLQQMNAVVKEDAAAIAWAYQEYKRNNIVPSTFNAELLTPYLNYASIDTSSNTVDHVQTLTTISCASRCYRMHNGSVLVFDTFWYFGGTNTTNANPVIVDPDGKVTDGTTNGPGKAVELMLYASGKITTRGTSDPATICRGGSFPAWPPYDPPWFSW